MKLTISIHIPFIVNSYSTSKVHVTASIKTKLLLSIKYHCQFNYLNIFPFRVIHARHDPHEKLKLDYNVTNPNNKS